MRWTASADGNKLRMKLGRAAEWKPGAELPEEAFPDHCIGVSLVQPLVSGIFSV